jgi:hypothetical protein
MDIKVAPTQKVKEETSSLQDIDFRRIRHRISNAVDCINAHNEPDMLLRLYAWLAKKASNNYERPVKRNPLSFKTMHYCKSKIPKR